MSSSSNLSDGRPYRLNNLSPSEGDAIYRQISFSSLGTDYALPAKTKAAVEVDKRDIDTRSADTADPFLDSNDEPNPANTRHGSELGASGHMYGSWTWEIISIIFSMLCMAAIVGVLLIYHSRPAPTLPTGITLNALISLLATILKAAMLVSVASCISQSKWQWFCRPRKLIYFNILDEASRGPWGSLDLLWKTRRPSVVGLGALITIFAIGVDPFMQQIISYPARSVQTGSSSLARAQMYDTGFSLDQFSGGVLAGPELGMKGAIYNGIFNQSSSNESTPNCSTGNCTFPLFDSLAFCSKCQNVTDKTILSGYTTGKSTQLGNTIANYTFSLPGNYTIMVTAFLEEGESAPLLYGPVMVSNFGMPESMSQSQLRILNPISSLAVLQWPDIEQLGYSGDYLKEMPQAWQCALYFCLQTYNTTVLKGVPKVDVVSITDIETPLPVIDQFPYDYVMTNDTTFQRPEDSLIKGGNATFSIPGGTIAAMASYLNYTMSGSQLMQSSETNGQDQWPNDVMQALNSTIDIAGMMSGLASSITTFMRQSDNRGSLLDTIATGIALKEETYVHVRWAWIALPVLDLLAAMIFLLVTIIRASRERIPVWKSSGLATLFNGLTGDDEDMVQTSFQGGRPLEGMKDMKEAAEMMKSRLQKGTNGAWSLAVIKQSGSEWD